MDTSRLEAFSDGVIAILITIMVLGLRAPHGADLAALRPIAPALITYLASFVFVGIYWSNHHHMLQLVEKVNGAILWANLHLLFWLSLIPFVTAWIAEEYGSSLPTATYGVVMLASAIAYAVLQETIIASQGPESRLRVAVGRDVKGKISGLMYAVAILLSFVHPALADLLYVSVSIIWLVPDKRIERVV